MAPSPPYFDRQDLSPCSTLHFRPEGALVGDASFFCHDQQCHLFYLSKRNDDPPRLSTCQLDHAVSADLLHWTQLPTALVPGGPGEPDEDGIGGSTIVYLDGIYHMFYAGTNPQVTYHAESKDLVNWKKDDPLNPVIVPDPRWYIPHDASVQDPYNEIGWRDPFIYHDNENRRYVMTVSARLNEGPWTERGCVAWATSKDLSSWEVQPPLYAPYIGRNLEVTELFQMDGRYFLIFCHGETNTTRYRVAEQLEGPYRCPADDILLPTYMYAPRTIELSGKRYLIPWVADRLNGSNDNQSELSAEGFTWGGALGTPQEIRSLSDGKLALFFPDIVEELAGEQIVNPSSLNHLHAERGEWKQGGEKVLASSDQGMARGMVAARGEDFLLSCRIRINRGVAAGLILRAAEGGEAGYYLRLEPGMKNISLWRYPRPWFYSRPMAFSVIPNLDYEQTIDVKVILHRHVLDAYVDNRHVVSRAVHDYNEGQFGLFIEDAEAEFGALVVLCRNSAGSNSADQVRYPFSWILLFMLEMPLCSGTSDPRRKKGGRFDTLVSCSYAAAR